MRRITILVSLAALAVSCGGRTVTFTPSAEPSPGAGGPILPPPVPASPAYVVRFDRAIETGDVEEILSTKGVTVVAPVRTKVVSVAGPSGARTLRVGSVEPLEYRAVAPSETRDAEFVWRSLLAGEAILTFEGASRLDIGDGDTLRIAGTSSVPVGAFADNGHPNVADVLVAPHIGDEIDMGPARTIVVGTNQGVTVTNLRSKLLARFPRAHVKKVETPVNPEKSEAPSLRGVAAAPGSLGPMAFEVLPGGFIRPDMAWVSANIARAQVPILGVVTCHRLLIPQLGGALSEIEQRGLGYKIYQYAGCYVPRFIDRNPKKNLSMHAFGLAFDINVASNGLGTQGDMDPEVVAIFEKWGFEWGGRWKPRPDPMHFELHTLISI
jgi:hypothetical protein